MKNIFLYFVAFLLVGTTSLLAKSISLTCEISGCDPADELFLYQFEGFGFTKLHTAKKNKEGNYTFKLEESSSKFYYLGKTPSKLLPIILGTEDQVKVVGTCNDFSQVSIKESKLNSRYSQLKIEIGQLKARSGKLNQRYQRAGSPEAKELAASNLEDFDNDQLTLLESFGDQYPLLTEIAALNTYLSFLHNQEGYYDEIDYFAGEYFRFVDFSNELHNNNPWVYESVREYTRTLGTANLDKALHQSYLDDMLNKFPTNAAAYQMALSGAVEAMSANRHPNYKLYGNKLIKKYEKTHPETISAIKKKINTTISLTVGSVAPDFAQLTPEGDSLSLSDLRGKVVLVDFWASWCGPCRRENPHVKKIYEKYKDKGFDVLGVSLDKTQRAWVGAIEKDGLPWKHVSDLKGWKNEVAQMYSVKSIPHTILLDQEGKIVASKLRGPQLEMELAKIFGE